MTKYLNPFTDQGFKLLFGREASKESLIVFLNDLLAGERQVEEITYLDKEAQPDKGDGRLVIFDIFCRDKDGTYFIVEMQNQGQEHFMDRGFYYLCRAVVDQGKRGKKWHYTICPVYGVYFLNFELTGLSKLRTDVVLTDRETGKEMLNGKLRQIYISLPYFDKKPGECANDYERWIYLIKNMDKLEQNPFLKQKAAYEKFLDSARVENLTGKERLRYEQTLKNYRDYMSIMLTAKKQATQQGLKEGMEKGIEKGREEEKRRLAQAFKSAGVDIHIIAENTGLTVEEITRL